MHFDGFKREGLLFIDEVIANNNKAWFEANRSRYEALILEPNKAYVEEMGEDLQILVPSIHAIPKTNQSLFRIYRDARLHPAEPIKTRIGIIFWQGSGHRMQSSSFYMHYDSREVFLAAGIRNFKPPLLASYRSYIQKEEKRQELHNILETLKKKAYLIPDIGYKRYPPGFDSTLPYAYLALYKAIYAYKSYKAEGVFFSKDIIDKNFKIYEDMFALQQWVYELTLYGEA